MGHVYQRLKLSAVHEEELTLIVECAEPLLGVEALEVLGLAVDPTTTNARVHRAAGRRPGGHRPLSGTRVSPRTSLTDTDRALRRAVEGAREGAREPARGDSP